MPPRSASTINHVLPLPRRWLKASSDRGFQVDSGDSYRYSDYSDIRRFSWYQSGSHSQHCSAKTLYDGANSCKELYDLGGKRLFQAGWSLSHMAASRSHEILSCLFSDGPQHASERQSEE